MMPDDSKRLVPVHKCWNDTEASIVIGFLESNGIDAVSSSEIAHSIYPITADGLAEVRIFVLEESAERAQDLLAEQAAASANEEPSSEDQEA
jgi:hypothetical protein